MPILQYYYLILLVLYLYYFNTLLVKSSLHDVIICNEKTACKQDVRHVPPPAAHFKFQAASRFSWAKHTRGFFVRAVCTSCLACCSAHKKILMRAWTDGLPGLSGHASTKNVALEFAIHAYVQLMHTSPWRIFVPVGSGWCLLQSTDYECSTAVYNTSL